MSDALLVNAHQTVELICSWHVLPPKATLSVQANDERGAVMEERSVSEHVRRAHETVRGEHQIAEYVARLEVEECARILASDPGSLPRLAALRDECRVGLREERSFEEVIRTWTEAVLSGAEGG